MSAALPLSHQRDVDTVSSSYSSKRNKPSNQGGDVLQQERGAIKTGERRNESLGFAEPWQHSQCDLSDYWRSEVTATYISDKRRLFYHASGHLTQSLYYTWQDNMLISGHGPVHNTTLLSQRDHLSMANFMSAPPWGWGRYSKMRCRMGLDEPIPLLVHLVLERWQLPLWWQTHKLCQADCKQKRHRSCDVKENCASVELKG